MHLSRKFFGDSYQTSRRVLKDKLKRFTLGHVYQLAFDATFNATFNAHNAYDDSKALADIIMRSEYTTQLIEDVKLSCKPLSSFHQKQAQEKVTNSNISELQKLAKNGNVANKLGKLGFSCELLKDMCGRSSENKNAFPISAHVIQDLNIRGCRKMLKI